jgi:hypothetical protein
MNASETADNMKHLTSIFGFEKINELERSIHFNDRTSDKSSATSVNSRFSEYDPVNRPNGWQIQSIEEVDETGKPLGKKPVSLEKFTRETGISERTVKLAVSLALNELASQEWIDQIEPVDSKDYHSVKLGKIALRVGSSLYSPVYFIPSTSKSGDTAWLAVRERRKITTVKFFPWNVDSETLATDALFSVNSDNSKYHKTSKLLMIPIEKPKPLTYDYFKSNFSVLSPGTNKTFFQIGLTAADDEAILINSVKRAFGSAVHVQSEITRMGRVEGVERERAESGKYFNLDLGEVFMYYNKDQNNTNLDYNKFNSLEIKNLVKPDNSRTRQVGVKNQKTGKTFTLKINPGDILRIVRKVKGGGSVSNKVEVTPTDNTPQNAKRISVRYVDAEQE